MTSHFHGMFKYFLIWLVLQQKEGQITVQNFFNEIKQPSLNLGLLEAEGQGGGRAHVPTPSVNQGGRLCQPHNYTPLIHSPQECLVWVACLWSKMSMPSFSWSIYIISWLMIHLTATCNYSKMYLILWNVGISSSSISGYDLKHKKRQNNALITWF